MWLCIFLFISASSHGEAFMPVPNQSAYFSIALRVWSKFCVIISLMPAKGWSLFAMGRSVFAMFTSRAQNKPTQDGPNRSVSGLRPTRNAPSRDVARPCGEYLSLDRLRGYCTKGNRDNLGTVPKDN